MKNIYFEGKVLWSQIDSNNHLRHSAYADFGAQARLELLKSLGFDADSLEKLKIGPILFREELIYLREIRPNDTVRVTCEMTHCRRDGSRWTFTQAIYRSDGVQAATINTHGAWVDIEKRKLVPLPSDWAEKFMLIPQTADFVLEEVPVKKTGFDTSTSLSNQAQSPIENNQSPTTNTMTELEAKFEEAKKRVMDLPSKPGNDVLLELYALNKQATLGDAETHGEKPAMFDFVAAAKFNAWKTKAGVSKEDAQQKYIDYVAGLFK